ncbi:MAG: hypothetical protein VW338_09885, partial [Rhodospirillaceae bacterium]
SWRLAIPAWAAVVATPGASVAQATSAAAVIRVKNRFMGKYRNKETSEPLDVGEYRTLKRPESTHFQAEFSPG